MANIDWDKLRTFNTAVETGSLTSAADTLGISQSAVSRQIAALEDQLGVSLFHRHPRGLQATEQGRILHEATHQMAYTAALAEAALADSRDKPSGPLRVTAPVAMGATSLVPRLRPFIEAYPEIELEIVLDDHPSDLSAAEVEAAIHLMEPTQSDLIQRRLGVVHQRLYASPDYIARSGMPECVDELKHHSLIAFGANTTLPQQRFDWLFGQDSPAQSLKPSLVVNAVLGMMHAIEGGLGIGSLPEYLGDSSRLLTPVLPKVRGPDVSLYFVYPEELRGNRRIAAFRDFLFRLIPSLRQ